MIIKEITEVQEPQLKIYEIYEEGTANTPDGKTVTILNLKEKLTKEELVNEIEMIGREISSSQTRLAERQAVLDQINSLE